MSTGEHRAWNQWLALPLLVAGAVLSTLVGVQEHRSQAATVDAAFRAVAEQARDRVADRLLGVEDTLGAFRAATLVSWPIDRTDFARSWDLVSDLETLDSVQSTRFARAVQAGEVASFEARVRADDSLVHGGYPDFSVSPARTSEDVRYVLEYLQPMAGNERVFGLDLGSEPKRRAAIDDAIDRGEAVATAPVDLFEGGGRAVLLMHAVYDTGTIPTTAPSRRRHAVGVTSAVVGIEELLRDVLGPDPTVELELYDVGATAADGGPGITEAGLLHRSTESSALTDGDPSAIEGRHQVLDLDVGGRRWRLFLTPSAGFDQAVGATPYVLGGAGFALSILLALLFASVSGARRRAEDLASRRTREVEHLILESPDATLVIDDDGIIRLASAQVRTVLGYEPAELVGTPVDQLVPPEHRGAHSAHRAAFGAANRSRRMGADVELSALRADGTAIPVEINLAPLETGGVIASVRDVRLQVAARRELERSNEQKTAFLGTVSHELRTPLVAIRGFVEVLRRRQDLDEVHRADYLERVVRNTVSLQRLIDELLEFSRLERDGLEIEAVDLDLAETVADVLDQLDSPSTRAVLRRELASTWCRADPSALERITSNLIGNAVKYSPRDAGVTVRVRSFDGDAELIVDDEGTGVDLEDRARIFERFVRGSNAAAGAVPGTGIGLSVVADLVHLMGGTVWVTDAPTGGARFVVRLPGIRGGQVASTVRDSISK